MVVLETLEFDVSYTVVMGMTCVVFLFIFRLVCPAFSRCITDRYSSLPYYTRMEWDDRMISNVHVVVAVTLALYVLIFQRHLSNEPIWTESITARNTCAIVVGYMIADIIVMVVYCQLEGFWTFLLHHAVSMYAYVFIMSYGVLTYFSMIRLLAESSTPFVNQRWYLDTLGYPKNSKAVLINGISMLIMFFVSRILTMPWYWYRIWLVTGTEEALRLGHVMLIMYIPCLVLDAFNVYWFYKMSRGAIKVLRSIN
ncbi:hypothetical protein ACJMK2_042054 [Sinanodonta woodiana]|uniref:TLC domain-containing protein n=1 Tax=Sinanodonta woodiana TaxID=1069815 RepID=A0ABD3W9C9_SINWO